MRSKRLFVVGLAVLSDHGPGAEARILRVSPDGSGWPGDTWANAYQTLSEVRIGAWVGDTIWVRGGTYYESVLIQTPVTILGGFAGTESEGEEHLRDPQKNSSIIDATGRDIGTVTCFLTCSVDGLTLTGGDHGGLRVLEGSSPEISNCQILENRSQFFGGGVVVRQSSSPKLDHCVITGNTAQMSGGGVSVEENSTATITGLYD